MDPLAKIFQEDIFSSQEMGSEKLSASFFTRNSRVQFERCVATDGTGGKVSSKNGGSCSFYFTDELGNTTLKQGTIFTPNAQWASCASNSPQNIKHIDREIFGETQSLGVVRARYPITASITQTNEEIIEELDPIFGHAVRNANINWEYAWNAQDNEGEYTFFVPPGDENFWKCYFSGETQFFQDFFRSDSIKVDLQYLDDVTGMVADTNEAGDILLSWDGVSSAQEYRIRYGTNENALDKEVTVGGTGATLSDVITGQRYFFEVSALDTSGEWGESQNKAAGSIDIPVITLRIENISFQPNAEGILVSWDPIPYAVTYTVHYGTDRNNLTESAETTETSLFLRFGQEITEGLSYYFSVTASDANGKYQSETNPIIFSYGSEICDNGEDDDQDGQIDGDDSDCQYEIRFTGNATGLIENVSSPLSEAQLQLQDGSVVFGNTNAAGTLLFSSAFLDFVRALDAEGDCQMEGVDRVACHSIPYGTDMSWNIEWIKDGFTSVAQSVGINSVLQSANIELQAELDKILLPLAALQNVDLTLEGSLDDTLAAKVSRIIFSWNALDGAEEYEVRHGTNPTDLSTTKILTNPLFLLQPLQVNTTYYFQARALGVSGVSLDGPWSDVVSVGPTEN